jgi:hypothetical protein
VVEVRKDRTRAQPSIRQALQREQGRLQLILARRGRQVVSPRVGLLLQNLADEGGRSGSSLRR